MTHSDARTPVDGHACPSITDIETYLQGEVCDERVLEHIASCEPCACRLEEMRQVNAFLENLIHDVGSALPTPTPAGIPAPADGLTFLKEIGRGGQGVVYEALQEGTNRTIAVKALHPGAIDSSRQRARFCQEIVLAASLDHPNIVTIHDVVDLPDGQLAYAMQRVDGKRLDVWIELVSCAPQTPKQRLSRVFTVFLKILRAVAYAHTMDVIHRDLKPGNVLVDAANEPHILDFGIACLSGEKVRNGNGRRQEEPSHPQTRTNEFVGSPRYAAPEQFTPGASVDERTDVYALGVMLKGAIEKLHNEGSARASNHRKTDIDWIIERAIAPDPINRYASASAFGDDVHRRLLHRPVAAHPRSIWYTLGKAGRRHPILLTAISCLFFALTAVMVVVLSQRHNLIEQSAAIAQADYLSSIDHANALIDSGSLLDAEQLLWDDLLTGASTNEIDRIGADGPDFTSPALWGLRSVYAQQPCICSFQTDIQGMDASPVISIDESGRLLFVLSKQGVVETWDCRNASLLRRVQLPDGPILSMATAGQSSFVALMVRRDPHRLTLLDMASGEVVYAEDCSWLFNSSHNETRPVIAVSSDASRMAIGVGARVLLVDRINGRAIPIGLDTVQTVASLDFDANAGQLLIADATQGFELRDASSGQLQTALQYADSVGPIGTVQDAWFLPEEHLVSLRGSAQYVLNTATNESHRVYWHNQMYQVRSSDTRGHWVATAFATEIIVRQMGQVDEHVLMLRGHRSSIRSLALHGGTGVLASLDSAGVIRLWDISGSRPARVIETPSQTVFSVDSSPDGERIFSGDSSGALRTWSWRTLAPIADVGATLNGMISRVAVSPDGAYVAVGGDSKDPRLVLISLPTGAHVMDLPMAGGRVTGLAFSPDSQRLAAASGNECVVVDISVGAELRITQASHNLRIKGLDFSSDGKTIVCTAPDGVFCLDASTLTQVGPTMKPAGEPRHIAASPVDNRVVADSEDSALNVFDRKTGRSLGKLIGHSLSDHWVDFHPSGELLVSAGEDGILKFWDMRMMRCLATFKAHGTALYCVRFVPGQLRVVTGDTRGRIGLWDIGSLDQYVAGNLEAAIARHGEDDLPPERLGRLRAWAKTRLAAY